MGSEMCIRDRTYVLRGAGVAISSIELLHVNTKYVRGPGGIDWTKFFTRLDVGDAVAVKLIDLPASRRRTREPVRNSLRLRVLGPVHSGQTCRLDQLPPPLVAVARERT